MASHLTAMPSTGRERYKLHQCTDVQQDAMHYTFFLLRVSRVPHRIAPRPSLAAQIAAKIETSAPRFVFQSAQIKQQLRMQQQLARVSSCLLHFRKSRPFAIGPVQCAVVITDKLVACYQQTRARSPEEKAKERKRETDE